jgi:hypothetical protein
MHIIRHNDVHLLVRFVMLVLRSRRPQIEGFMNPQLFTELRRRPVPLYQ